MEKNSEKTVNLNGKKSLMNKNIMRLKKICLKSFRSHIMTQNIEQLSINFKTQGRWARVKKKKKKV